MRLYLQILTYNSMFIIHYFCNKLHKFSGLGTSVTTVHVVTKFFFNFHAELFFLHFLFSVPPVCLHSHLPTYSLRSLPKA
jgi:hypothetical protein